MPSYLHFTNLFLVNILKQRNHVCLQLSLGSHFLTSCNFSLHFFACFPFSWFFCIATFCFTVSSNPSISLQTFSSVVFILSFLSILSTSLFSYQFLQAFLHYLLCSFLSLSHQSLSLFCISVNFCLDPVDFSTQPLCILHPQLTSQSHTHTFLWSWMTQSPFTSPKQLPLTTDSPSWVYFLRKSTKKSRREENQRFLLFSQGRQKSLTLLLSFICWLVMNKEHTC